MAGMKPKLLRKKLLTRSLASNLVLSCLSKLEAAIVEILNITDQKKILTSLLLQPNYVNYDTLK